MSIAYEIETAINTRLTAVDARTIMTDQVELIVFREGIPLPNDRALHGYNPKMVKTQFDASLPPEFIEAERFFGHMAQQLTTGEIPEAVGRDYGNAGLYIARAQGIAKVAFKEAGEQYADLSNFSQHFSRIFDVCLEGEDMLQPALSLNFELQEPLFDVAQVA